MTTTPTSHQRSPGAWRGGFTFLEVLFAIIVLGIGFIMVAAMFPAALKQTQASVEDTAAGSIWVNASRGFLELGRNQVTPVVANQKLQYFLDQKMPFSGSAAGGDSIVWCLNDRRMPAQGQKDTF